MRVRDVAESVQRDRVAVARRVAHGLKVPLEVHMEDPASKVCVCVRVRALACGHVIILFFFGGGTSPRREEDATYGPLHHHPHTPP